MTHDELCVRAVRWLRGTCRCNPVYSRNASCSEIPDAIGWTSRCQMGPSIVVECKTSVSDFYADKKKYLVWWHKEHQYNMPLDRMTKEHAEQHGYEQKILPRMGYRRFYLCEPGVLTPKLIEKHAPDHGLIYRTGVQMRIVKEAPKRENPNLDAEIRYLRFAIINGKEPHAEEEESQLSLVQAP